MKYYLRRVSNTTQLKLKTKLQKLGDWRKNQNQFFHFYKTKKETK